MSSGKSEAIMWIRIISGRAGPKYAYAPGDVVDHQPDAEARRWVELGRAEIASAPEPEAAVGRRAPEAAVIRRRRRASVTPPSVN